MKVTFGHGGRHITGDVQGVENAIAHDVVGQNLSAQHSITFDIKYNGIDYSYRAIDRGEVIHIGTYFYKRF